MQDRQLARMAEVVRKREKEKQVGQLFTDPAGSGSYRDIFVAIEKVRQYINK
jgi:hypothetical protein